MQQDSEPTIQDDIRAVCKLIAIEYFSTSDNLKKPLFLRKEEILDFVSKIIKENYNYTLPMYGFSDIILTMMVNECQNYGINLKLVKG
jgi:hypothetical protein